MSLGGAHMGSEILPGGGGSGVEMSGIGRSMSGLSDGSRGAQEHCVHVAVPDTDVGAIFGRGGQTMNELQQISGARIKVSQRGDYLPGTENRIVTIVGSLEACQTCSWLVQQRVGQVRGGG